MAHVGMLDGKHGENAGRDSVDSSPGDGIFRIFSNIRHDMS